MKTWILRCALAASAFGCAKYEAAPSASAPEESEKRLEFAPEAPALEIAAAPAQQQRMVVAKSRGGKMKKEAAFADMLEGAAGGAANAMEEAPAEPKPADGKDQDEGQSEGEPARTRSYFPETFLFEPAVLTDSSGLASLSVRVPDRLTTWRILALAHSRDGAQAGTETSFVGTLPAYVDPIIPGFLYAGDEARIPIQVVNTTADAFTRTLRVEASGSAKALSEGPVKVEGWSSKVEPAVLKANKPGTILLKASLGDKDAVERTIPVLSTGRPLSERRGGTLAAPRSVDIELPENADPDSTSARLLVFPGALAILRAELSAASGRGGAAGDAYALLLAGRGPSLLQKLGGDVDEKSMRAMAIVAGQRAIRYGRSPDTLTAALFTEAALSHPDNPVIARLGERLSATMANAQRPDGTFEGGNGWTLQRLLVTTAECTRAARAGVDERAEPRAKQRAQRASLLAEGAFERNMERVEDAYTAAAIAASGAVEGTLLEKLRKRVRDKIRSDSDGAKSLPIEEGVVRSDGTVPSEIEATALAVLALEGDKEATILMPDLGARLLGAYDPRFGFGDGRTNLVALRAVLALFKEPLPSRVKVVLSIDDRAVAEGVLEGNKLKEVLVIEAALPSAKGAHKYRIEAEPPVAGLGYSLTLKTHVPWEKDEADGGLELAVTVPKDMAVGRAADLVVEAAAPQGYGSSIELSLPAGVQLDKSALDALQESGSITGYQLAEGAASLELPPLPSGAFRAVLKAIPTLAGTLHSGPSTITLGNNEYLLPPVVWAVR